VPSVFLVRPSVAAAAWRSPLVALALMIAFWFSFPVVAQYAGIWDARANPKPDVEVQLSSTTKMRGELSRTWQGDFQLREDNGALHTFGRDVAVMTFPMPHPMRGTATGRSTGEHTYHLCCCRVASFAR
jgi:hypothetical protein